VTLNIEESNENKTVSRFKSTSNKID